VSQAAAVTRNAEQQQQQAVEDSVQQEGVKRVKPRGGVWVPPHRRPDYRCVAVLMWAPVVC
jgi:hypothetical protein